MTAEGPGVCYCGAYGGGIHTKSSLCPTAMTADSPPERVPAPERIWLFRLARTWYLALTEPNKEPYKEVVSYIRETPLTKAAGEMREALEFAELALTDWAHTYAADQCPDAAGLSWSRIEHRGGALAYIFEALRVVRAAITKGEQQEVLP